MVVIMSLIGGLTITVGDILMREWSETNTMEWFTIGILLYLIGMVILIYSYKYKKILVATVIMALFNKSSMLIIDVFIYKESLTKLKIAAVLLAIVTVIILESSGRFKTNRFTKKQE